MEYTLKDSDGTFENAGVKCDFSRLQIQIKQESQFAFVPQDTSELKSNQNLKKIL